MSGKPASKWRIAVEVACILLVIFGVIAAAIIAAQYLSLSFGGPLPRIQRISEITLFAWCVGLCFFVALTAFGLSNYHNGDGFSSLYLPLLFFATSLFMWLCIQAIGAVDILYHDGPARWSWRQEPEISMYVLILIISFAVVAPGWILAVSLRLAHWSYVSIGLVFFGIAVSTAVILNTVTRLE